MKNLIIFKVLFVLPVILFVDYLIMVIIGCTTCLFGLGNDFYCGPYCIIGKIVLGLSALLFLFIIFPDIKELFKKNQNASTTEK